jgi:membrane-anchored protein YejM (alkaline phosphatase superfamily)
MSTYHNVLLHIDFAAFEDITPFLHLDVHTFETQLLAALLESIIGKHVLYQLADKMIQTTISFAIEKFPFED